MVLALLFAAAMVTYSFVWMYYVRWEADAEIGMDTNGFSPVTGAMEINKIYSGSPAEHAGLKVHDQIVAVDGRVLSTAGADYLQKVWLHRRPGDTVTLTIHRPGEPDLLNVTTSFRAVAGTGSLKNIAEEVIASFPVVFLVVGLSVLFLRLEDRSAWLLACLCAGLISASRIPDSTVAMDERLRTFILGYRAIFLGALAFSFYMFFAIFPRRSPLDRRAPWLKWAIAVLGVFFIIPGLTTGNPHSPRFVFRTLGDGVGQYVTLIYIYSVLVVSLASLCWSAFKTTDPEAQRKFRVILWGTVAGIAPVTATRFTADFGHVRLPFWVEFFDVVCLTLFPLSFAYAVVKHRVMEIPVLLKQSARYLLVRRGFAVLLVLLALSVNVVLGIGLSRLFHLYPGLAMSIGTSLGIALAWVAAPGIRRATNRIDRAFFRGAYDARIILQQLAQNIRSVTSKEQLPSLIEKELANALHPGSQAIYLRDGEGNLQPTPPEPFLRAVAADSVRTNRLLQLKEPVEGSRDGEISAEIPELAPLRAEFVVPILSRGGELMGLIVLGEKLSQEPYSREDQQLLGSVAAQAGLVLESIDLAEKMAERMDAERRAQQELQIARTVQSKLLPQQCPPLQTLDYAGACVQARAVGGDYYDFLDLGPGRVGFVLADIAGKGISGALLMANLQASLRSLHMAAERDLPHSLESVNRLFVKNTETSHYATVFFGIYEDASRKLTYANCGHNPPVLLRASGEIERLQATATVIGLFEPWECAIQETRLQPGDTLVIFTDGITEAANRHEEEFGEDRLIALLRRSRSTNADQLLEQLIASVKEFSPDEQGDDLTAIVAICK